MTVREDTLRKVEAFIGANGLTERHFGIQAFKNHKWVDRLRDGRVTLTSIERAEQFMRDFQRKPPPAPATAPADKQAAA